MAFNRSGLAWTSAFGLAVGTVAVLREATLWMALVCGAVTAVVVLLTRYTAVKLVNRPPSLKLPHRAEKAAKRIRNHAAKVTSAGSGRDVTNLTYEIEYAIKRWVDSASTDPDRESILDRTVNCVDKLEDLSRPDKLHGRQITGLIQDLQDLKAELDRIKPVQRKS